MSEPRPADPVVEAYSLKMKREKDRLKPALVVGACLIAVIRLAREPEISTRNARVMAAVGESISLAELIVSRVLDR
jgi:hypothetical protein